jgi:hypothetical protein
LRKRTALSSIEYNDQEDHIRGQTGADRAACDVAWTLGIPLGGWIPKNRKIEDGPLPEKFGLQEMPTDSYEARTEKNVQESDGTLIIARGRLTGASDYTRHMTLRHKKKLLGIGHRR